MIMISQGLYRVIMISHHLSWVGDFMCCTRLQLNRRLIRNDRLDVQLMGMLKSPKELSWDRVGRQRRRRDDL